MKRTTGRFANPRLPGDQQLYVRCRLPAVVLLTTLLVLQACAPANNGVSRISLQRTVCFGVCPVYRVSIYPDGLVEFHGERFVEAVGDHSDRVDSENFSRLVAFANEINFFELNDEYRVRIGPDNSVTTVTDLPSRITSIERNGETKTVLNYFGGPESLEEFETLIDELTRSAQWIGEPGTPSF